VLLAFLLVLLAREFSRAQTPPPDDAAGAAGAAPVQADPDSLIRYVPKQDLRLLLEFQGIDAHEAAWNQSAAAKILNETKTGSMLRELLTQLYSQAAPPPAGSPGNGQEDMNTIEHVLRSGILIAINASTERKGITFVFRDAFRDDVRPLFARGILHMMQPGTKPELVDKPGGRRVALMRARSTSTSQNPEGMPIAWWVEDRKDLVITVPPDHCDTVIATLSNAPLSAKDHPSRAKLSAREGKLEPVGWMFVDLSDLDSFGTLPPQASQLGLDRVKSLQARWALDGPALHTLVELEAPSPRAGVLAFVDQPTFNATSLPALPENLDSFAVASIDFDGSLAKFTELTAQMGQAQAAQMISDAEAAFKKATKLDLRDDVLRQIGPRVVTYFPKKKTGTAAALNALNPLAGMQIPSAAALIEIKDEKAMNRTLTSLMSYANKELVELTTPPEPAAGARPAGSYAGGAQAGRSTPAKKSTRPARSWGIRMTLPDPLTYQLTLPAEMSALLNIKPTLILGKRHIILATSPDLAKEALALESSADSRWVPSGDFAQTVDGLPSQLVYLQVTDPRDTIPQAITKLPTSLENAVAAVRSAVTRNSSTTVAGPTTSQPGLPPTAGANLEPGVAVRGPGAGAARGPRGASPGGGSGGSFRPPGAGSGPPGGAYAGFQTGPPPGVSGGAPPASPATGPTGPIKLQIPPDLMPKASDIRPLLFPGSFAVAVDDKGIRMIGRDAFLGIDSLVVFLDALPMIAAQAGAPLSGPTRIVQGGAFPGAPGTTLPGAPGAAIPSGAPPAGASGGTRPGPSRAD
jgi:hypothetical protein